MADDGMLTNFDVTEALTLVQSKTVFKGGRWKDRVKAKRAVKHWEKKQQRLKQGAPTEAEAGDGGKNPTMTPAEGAKNAGTGGAAAGPTQRTGPSTGTISGKKRKRGDGGEDGNGLLDGDYGGRSTQRQRQRQRPRTGGNNDSGNNNPQAGSQEKGRFISSLWTYNPTATTATPQPPEIEQEPQAPTNAPISDGSATFTTLGLSPALGTHLTTKMSLKTPTAIQKTAIPELLTSDSDVFIQAQTGSGKTLTYLLPILDRIMSLAPPSTTPAANATKLHRSSGLFAIILAPTRELSRQIMSVLTTLTLAHSYHWIVPGCVTGGEKKKSEKARLRKGTNILVATPGRLLDHLENTESLDVSQVRWMVLDEGDRLMELGFEESIARILELVAKRSRIEARDKESAKSLPKRRVTMLCSATMKSNVQRLGDISLKEASFIKADPEREGKEGDGDSVIATALETVGGTFLAPAQLRQSYLLVPPKQRHVALYAVLRRTFMRAPANMKVIVFFSCADSVDFHFEAFSRALQDEPEPSSKSTDSNEKKKQTPPHPTVRSAPLLHPNLLLHRLHGSLPQPQRTLTLHSFTHGIPPSSSTPAPKKITRTPPPPPIPDTPPTTPPTPTADATTTITTTTTTKPLKSKPAQLSRPTLLFSTDVSSRGLDLPNVDLVLQFDPPFSRDDYLHRIGRSARAGRPGRALIFLIPGSGEETYVKRVIEPTLPLGAIVKQSLLNEALENGFCPPSSTNSTTNKKSNEGKRKGGHNHPAYEDLATAFQLNLENWVLEKQNILQLAKRAWTSHIRAYTTHETSERDMFDLKALHVGHLAKGFGLREKPGEMSHAAKSKSKSKPKAEGGDGGRKVVGERKSKWDREDQVGVGVEVDEARERMRRMAKMMQRKSGLAGEFNIG